MSNPQSSPSSRKCYAEPSLTTSKINKERIKKKPKQKQKQQSPRSPLKDVYNGVPISRNNSDSSSISSSMSSIDAPSGCLRFFSKTPLHNRPHNRYKPKFLSKTTSAATARKSAPNPSNPPPSLPHKLKKKLGQSISSANAVAPPNVVKTFPDFENRALPAHQELPEKCYSGEPFSFPGFGFVGTSSSINHHVVGDCSPDDGKTMGERSNTSGNSSKTPPIQSSLSPEIHGGSSVLVSGVTPSTTTCYGAGHVVSGITDRRKCRPRGTLVVGGTHSSGCPNPDFDVFDEINDENCTGAGRKSRPSYIPLPAEASMSWNLSPSYEVEGGNVEVERGMHELHKSQNLVTSATQHSPCLPRRFDSNMFRYVHISGSSNTDIESSGKTRITLLSPKTRPDFQECLGPSYEKVAGRSSSASPCATPVLSKEEKRSSLCNFPAEKSPFSLDSLGSGNVIQTPKSDSSKETHVSRSWLNEGDDQKLSYECELDSMAELLRVASLSPKSNPSLWDPLGLGHELAGLNSPSNSNDLNLLQSNLDGRVSCFSNSTFENVSDSQMRISWRDGLVSQIFEMDDLDFCRLLSDEESEADGYDNGLLKSHLTNSFNVEVEHDDGQVSNDGLRSPEFLEHEVKVNRKGKTMLSPNQPNSCAESICTDGGGLIASGDADWTLCYKNQLFEV